MSDRFDPYYRWLSIPPEEQPPHHYRLLGLKLYEGDVDVIESAADRQMTHVRTFQSGKYAEQSQRILNEIATAKVTLLDGVKKADYDAQLRTKQRLAAGDSHLAADDSPAANVRANRALPTAKPLVTAQPLPPVAQPPTVAPPAGAASEPVARAVPSICAGIRQRRKSLPLAAVAAVGAAVILVAAVLGAVVMMVRPWETATPVAVNDRPPGEKDPAPPPPPVLPPNVEPSGKTGPSEETEPEETVPEEADPPQEETPQDPPAKETSADPPEEVDVDQPIDEVPAEEAFVAERPARVPIPSKAERDARQASIDSIFQTAKAKTPAEKADLAAQLYRTATETPDDVVAQFVMLNLARQLAADTARMQLAFDAIDLLEQQFEFDWDTVRLTSIAQGAKAMVPNETKQEVITLGVQLADELAAADRYDDASKLLTGLVELARRARESQLAAALVERRRVNESLHSAYKSAQGAFQTLEKSPDDPAANLAVGRFHLLVKNDTAHGLKHLAQGSDKALAAAAKLELTSPQTPDEQEKLADAWWNLAAQETDKDVQKKLQSRAFAWYQRAKPELKGLASAKADKRLTELAAAGVQPADINLDLGIFDDDPSEARPRRLPTNLLDLVDTSVHAVKQTWSRSGSDVVSDGGVAGLLKVPVTIEGSYDLRVAFTRTAGHDIVGLVLPVGERYCDVLLSILGGAYGGISMIDGKDLSQGPVVVRPSPLSNSERHVLQVRVTLAGDEVEVVTALDGKPFAEWSGPTSSLSIHSDRAMPETKHFGLYAHASKVNFHELRLTMLDGRATADADVVLSKPVAKPRLPANLLELVDVDAHAINQKWTRDKSDIIAPKSFAALLKIPATVDGGYDATLQFTRTDGGDIVGLVLPVAENTCEVMLSIGGGDLGGIAQIDGKPLGEGPAKVSPCRLTNGQRYTLRARVTLRGDQASIDTTLDGQPLVSWAGAAASLSVGGHRDVRAAKHFGLYANDAQVSFHSLAVTTIGGRVAADADAVLPRSSAATPRDDATRGLVAHWTFDEVEGTVARDSVGANDGEIRGASRTKGVRGGALRFNGQSDFVFVGNPEALRLEGSITLAAWVKVQGLPAVKTVANVVAQRYTNHQEAYLRLIHSEKGVGIQTGGASDEEGVNVALAAFPESDANEWILFAGVFDGNTWYLYRQGRLLTRLSHPKNRLKTDGDWAIGGHAGGDGKFFHGEIDDVRIYNRGLSADEVKLLFDSDALSIPEES